MGEFLNYFAEFLYALCGVGNFNRLIGLIPVALLFLPLFIIINKTLKL